MLYKTRFIWVTALAVLIGWLIVGGCATKQCVDYAYETLNYCEKKGIPARIGMGYINGVPHSWCEYYDKEWYVWDNAQMGKTHNTVDELLQYKVDGYSYFKDGYHERWENYGKET
jgi:hypothetical protein